VEEGNMTEERELGIQEAEKREVEESDAERTRDRRAFVPRTDIYETDEAIFLVADVPGVDENSLEITLEKNVLTINGYVTPTPPEGYTLSYAEYDIGDYVRRFSLSNEIDQQGIEASVKDGTLHLHLPKIGPTVKKIDVTAG
jgi:HSP20 family molecular chaperone IbpA